MTTEPSAFSAANDVALEKICTTPEASLSATALESPPYAGSPQVTTDPSAFSTANAKALRASVAVRPGVVTRTGDTFIRASAASLNEPPNRLDTVAPVIDAVGVTTLTGASVAVPDATGASFDGVTTMSVANAVVNWPSNVDTVRLRLVVEFDAGWYVIFPAVAKNAFRSLTLPANVRAVGVPPTVTFPPFVAAITPSATDRVTVSVAESSENGLPGNTRLDATSSTTAKEAGTRALGCLLFGTTETVRILPTDKPPESTHKTLIEYVFWIM